MSWQAFMAPIAHWLRTLRLPRLKKWKCIETFLSKKKISFLGYALTSTAVSCKQCFVQPDSGQIWLNKLLSIVFSAKFPGTNGLIMLCCNGKKNKFDDGHILTCLTLLLANLKSWKVVAVSLTAPINKLITLSWSLVIKISRHICLTRTSLRG